MNDENDGLMQNRASFDEKPIGKKNKFEIPQYADNQYPAIISQTNNPEPIPLNRRIISKVWKTKRDALDEVLALVKDDPSVYEPYQQITLDFIAMNKAQIQERGLKILLIYLSAGRKMSIESKVIVKTIVQKCLTIDKQEIKSSCHSILFWYMDNKFEEMLLNQLNDELLNKNPKIISTTLAFLYTLLNNYGIRRMKNMQQFSKHLEYLSTPPKPMAKPQTIQFYKQLYKWMGQNTFKQFKIHAQVKDELVKFAKDYQKIPMEIKRGIRIQQTGDGKKQVFHMQDEQDQNQQPLDVLCHYTPKWVDDTLAIQKWKDKKIVLQQFIKKTKVNVIVNRETSHFITLIKRLLTDNNINLLLCGFQITQNLAKGLKKNFAIVSKNIQSYIFGKLKDAKPAIVEAAQLTLKSLLYSLTLQDLLEDIKAGLDDKAPTMRKQILKFLLNFVNKKQLRIINLMKGLVDKICKMTEDGSVEVRSQALELLCNLKKMHDMKFFGDKLKNLDLKKLHTIQSAKASQGQQMMEIQQNPYATQIYHQSTPMIEEAPIKEIKPKSNKLIPKQPQAIAKKASLQQISIKSNSSNTVGKGPISSHLNQISSPHESVRLNAYQHIMNKSCSIKDIYLLKSKAVKQCSPTILKTIIHIIKKNAINDIIDLESLQFLCMHDWRKVKNSLLDFVQTNRFSLAAQDFIKNNPALFSVINPKNAMPSTQNTALQISNIKKLMFEMQNLIPKMSNPQREVKLKAAEQVRRLLQSMPKISSESDLNTNNGWNQQLINQFYNIAKFRLSELDYEIGSSYCKVLLEMINKGIAVKNKGVRLILPTVFGKLKQGHADMKQLLNVLTQSNPIFIFSVMLGEIHNQNNRDVLLQFIIQNNQLFIRNADLKAYMGPLLHIISNITLDAKLRNSCQQLLDQMVQLSGQNVLQAEVKKLKIANADNYLAKFNITISKPAVSMNNMTTKHSNINKADRLKMDQQNPWPIQAVSNHILKLINTMISVGGQLTLLINPLPIGAEQIGILQSLEMSFLIQYSDLLFKWIYWRTAIDGKEEVQEILKFACKLIIAVHYSLSQGEVVILLSSLINCLKRFQRQCLSYVYQIHRKLFMIGFTLKQKSFRFWINSLFDQSIVNLPIDQILLIFTFCYPDLIPNQLVTFARIPEAMKNQEFMNAITLKCDPQLLKVSGFKNINDKKTGKTVPQADLKQLLSDLGGPQHMINITAQQKRLYISIFQKLSSNEMINKLNQLTTGIQSDKIVEMHLKIIYSVIVPYMKRQISTINIFTYFKQFTKFVQNTQGLISIIAGGEKIKYSLYLKDLTRMLVYFLIDLDENILQNKQQITRTVNKIILLLLEHSECRHMLQILLLLLKTHIKLNISSKILHLLIKCAIKICKGNGFKTKLEDNCLFVICQINTITKDNSITLDHPIIKSLKNLINDLSVFPSFNVLTSRLIEDDMLHPTLIAILQQIRNTQNQNINYPQPPAEVQKQSNPLKSMGAVGIHKLAAIKKLDNNP